MIRAGAPIVAVALVCTALPAAAQVRPESYTALAREADGRIGFETLPQRPEPGFDLDAPLREPGATIGERFAGQRATGTPHDHLSGGPSAPLTVAPGPPGRNLSVAFHRGFGSNALFPLGPDGFPALTARGEGAAAVLFDHDQAAFGLLVHSDYADPLGARAPRGDVVLRLYDRTGRLIGTARQRLEQGINRIALRRDGNIPDIAGVTITNTDPGGIAIDDILFQKAALTG